MHDNIYLDVFLDMFSNVLTLLSNENKRFVYYTRLFSFLNIEVLSNLSSNLRKTYFSIIKCATNEHLLLKKGD